jgi:hypothetical protein
MGEKKKNEAWVKTVSKIFIVFACLLFVGLMILSGMGNQWITMFNSVKSGDTVVLDVTVYDAAGRGKGREYFCNKAADGHFQ